MNVSIDDVAKSHPDPRKTLAIMRILNNIMYFLAGQTIYKYIVHVLLNVQCHACLRNEHAVPTPFQFNAN